MAKNLLFIELNEFSPKLLFEAADAYGFKHIKKLRDLHQSNTYTSDTYDSGYLEPWVQWVSIHTGTPAEQHKIKHLGDISLLKKQQLWEALSQEGISSGVWGVLNGSKGASDKCRFFLPDPWTFSESAYPKEIDSFVALPRYMAKNYLNPNWLRVFLLGIRFLTFIVSPKTIKASLTELPRVIWNFIRYRGAHFVAYSFVEYLSALRFLEYRRKYSPQCSVLFLNLIAHIQHYYWDAKDILNNNCLRYGMHYIDRILEAAFANLEPGTELVVANGFSQINTNHEAPWVLYRQIDHTRLLNAIGISRVKVEACMTHDAHLFFENAESCQQAMEILKDAHVISAEKHPLFHVEPYEGDQKRLFYMIKFTDPAKSDLHFSANGNEFRFMDFFSPIIQRTGKHIGSGVVFATKKFLPAKIENFELFRYLINLAKEPA